MVVATPLPHSESKIRWVTSSATGRPVVGQSFQNLVPAPSKNHSDSHRFGLEICVGRFDSVSGRNECIRQSTGWVLDKCQIFLGNSLCSYVSACVMIHSVIITMFVCIRQQDLQQSSDSRPDPLGPLVGSLSYPVVWGIVFVCGLRSVTTVYETAEESEVIWKKKMSTFENFFWQMKMMDSILKA